METRSINPLDQGRKRSCHVKEEKVTYRAVATLVGLSRVGSSWAPAGSHNTRVFQVASGAVHVLSRARTLGTQLHLLTEKDSRKKWDTVFKPENGRSVV